MSIKINLCPVSTPKDLLYLNPESNFSQQLICNYYYSGLSSFQILVTEKVKC